MKNNMPALSSRVYLRPPPIARLRTGWATSLRQCNSVSSFYRSSSNGFTVSPDSDRKTCSSRSAREMSKMFLFFVTNLHYSRTTLVFN